MKRATWLSILVSGSLMVVSSSAWADGVLVSPSALANRDKVALQAAIQTDRTVHPQRYAALESIRLQLPRLDAQKRGRLAPVSSLLNSMGADALLPMVRELAFEAEPRRGLTASAWIAWRVGLLEAVGRLRDPRSEPVLGAILETNEQDFLVVRSATEAFAKLATDQVASRLIALSRSPGPKQRAILAGMGHCRRVAIASHLARVVDTHPAPETAQVVVHSLGDVGSNWAWKTPIVAGSGEEAATRAAAAEALVKAFVAYDGDVRATASDALMVVDDPSTPALIQSALQGASPSLTDALNQLSHRFANNPTR